MAISKAVVAAAGLGTRMLPFTKEQPKEMLPIYYKGCSGVVFAKPIIQCIFEQLFDIGIDEFCFIIGRSKRIIEDHFTIDEKFLELLKYRGDDIYYNELKLFYTKIEKSVIFWVNQHIPKGFGHAVLQSEAFVGNNPCVVHAGDVCIFSSAKHPLLRMLDLYEVHCNEIDAILLAKRIKDIKLLRQHGIIIPDKEDYEGENNIISVKGLIEKPENPPSELAIMPIYIFKSNIFKALREVNIDKRGELQLTDAIEWLVNNNKKVIALEMLEDDIRVDVGTPYIYTQSINTMMKRLEQVE